MAMGLWGTTIATIKGHELYGYSENIGLGLTILTGVISLSLLIIYLWKYVKYPEAVKEEFNHPIRRNFFAGISITFLLAAIATFGFHSTVSFWLWLVGTTLQTIFLITTLRFWVDHKSLTIDHITPPWFIPVVGAILVPVVGVFHAPIEISWMYFAVGLIFWGILSTILFSRFFFGQALPSKLLPTLSIMVAPPSVAVISYFRLTGQLDTFTNILYFFAVFLFIFILTFARKFRKTTFSLTWWAYTFPLAALIIASLLIVSQTETVMIPLYLPLLVILHISILTIVSIQTILAIKAEKICIPE
jgi:tellurite resistance protein